MAKVLISFIGTGGLDKYDSTQGRESREYKKAKYRFGSSGEDGDCYETSFVAEALAKHFHPDKIILLGTVHSMWERVYEVFAESKGAIDENFYCELADHTAKADHTSSLELPGKEKIESALGENCHIELIRYGLNQDEIEQNAAIILGLERYLQNNDELIIDITHSFRSLPLYIMSLLNYLKTVSRKRIDITHITYGMLDVTRELQYTPIIDLKSILSISEWIFGAQSLVEYGNSYKIAELLGEENPDVAKRLKDFSDDMNTICLGGIRTQVQKLSGIKNAELKEIPAAVVKPAVQEIANELSSKGKMSNFQFKMAKWYFEHYNFSSSAISLAEAIISYVRETLNLDDSQESEELAKCVLGKTCTNFSKEEIDRYRKRTPNIDVLSTVYWKINKIRNAVAHLLATKNNSSQIIKTLESNIKKVTEIFRQ